jgi:hypothetical protein
MSFGDGTSGGIGVVLRLFIHAIVVVNYLACATSTAVEGEFAGKHDRANDATRPEVDRHLIALAVANLGRQIKSVAPPPPDVATVSEALTWSRAACCCSSICCSCCCGVSCAAAPAEPAAPATGPATIASFQQVMAELRRLRGGFRVYRNVKFVLSHTLSILPENTNLPNEKYQALCTASPFLLPYRAHPLL